MCYNNHSRGNMEDNNKILNIYGIYVDRATHPYDVRMRENAPSSINKELLDKIKSLQDVYSEGFLVYGHCTSDADTCEKIKNNGLMIYEKGGGLDSTMSLVFDSYSNYHGGDYNYLFNYLNQQSAYGQFKVFAVFERKKLKASSAMPSNIYSIERNGKVDSENILGYITPENKIFFNYKFKTPNNIELKTPDELVK